MNQDINTIESSYEEKVKKLNRLYSKMLDKLLLSVQKTGDLDQTTMVQEEIERFFKSKTMPTVLFSKTAFKKKQLPFIKESIKYRSERAKKILTLVSKYEKTLSSLQKKLVKFGSINEAKLVQGERNEVSSSAKVTNAREFLSTQKEPVVTTSNKKVSQSQIISLPSKNLIKNPGCELPSELNKIPEWKVIAGDNWIGKSRNPAPHKGKSFFFAGVSAFSELRQDLDVSLYEKRISEGRQKFRFEGFTSSWKQQDTARIVIEYLDKSKEEILDSYDSKELANRKWKRISKTQVAPIGTYFIRIRLIAQRNAGDDNDGYFDTLALKAIR